MIYGVFGGSFDPPHMSHVLAALWALETGEVDRVLVIPCGQHALGKSPGASFEDRMEMCRRAFARLAASVEVLDIEGRRAEVSYTIDTLRALAAARPGSQWRLLIGTDILNETHRWRAWDEIRRVAPPLVVPRMTGQTDEAATETSKASPEKRAAGSPDGDLRALSSRQLRRRLGDGENPVGLLPASVLDYIRRRGLYGASDCAS